MTKTRTMSELEAITNRVLDALHLKRAVSHYEDACEMADLLTRFGITSNGSPIEVIDGDKSVLTYGVLITEESFEALKALLLEHMNNLKGNNNDKFN